MLNRNACFYGILQDETARLADVHPVGRRVVHQRYVLASLHQSVEVIGIYSHLSLDGCKTEITSQRVRNERSLIHGLWQFAFVYRKHYEVAEIEVSGLENAHNLKSDGWLAVERNRRGSHNLVEQFEERYGHYVEFAIIEQRDEAVQHRVSLKQRLGIELCKSIFRVVAAVFAIVKRNFLNHRAQIYKQILVAVLRLKNARQIIVAINLEFRRIRHKAIVAFEVLL